MKQTTILLLLVLMACGGTLTEEQRKAIKNEMNTQRIQKVSEAEITEAAFAKGRRMVELASASKDSASPDSVQVVEGQTVRYCQLASKNLTDIERQLMEAYIDAEAAGNLEDNIQNIRSEDGLTDSILYTKPVVTKNSEGDEKLTAMWSVLLSKKDLILSMDKK
jgi:hypothetical protein